MFHISSRAPQLTDFGDLFEPEEAAEPILAQPTRAALTEWLTEIWAEDELKAVGIGPRRRAMFDGAPGVGKAQPVDSLVLTTEGWRTINDLRIGDALASIDGDQSNVTGIFPRGNLPVFEVQFSDGARARCSGDHLWGCGHKRWRKPRVLSTTEIVDLLSSEAGPPICPYVPLFSGSFGRDDLLPLDPFLLGLLLGDGSFTDSNSSIHFTQADETVVAQFKAALPSSCEAKLITRYDYRIVNRQRNNEPTSVAKTIAELGLSGKLSYDKFIPRVYFSASKDARRDLLRGLLATDGYSKGLSRIEFYTSSEQLSTDVVDLIRSLGGIASRKTQYKNYTHKSLLKQGRQSWRIGLLHPFGRDLLTKPKHRERDGSAMLSDGQSRRKIVSVEGSGELVPMACISVSHPSGLYITNDYVVTHNTTLAHHLAARLGLSMIAVRPDRIISKWVGETGERIGKLFELAASAEPPVLVFLDEFDALSRQRRKGEQASDDSRNEEVDTLLQRLEQHTGYLIAATNFASHIDQAIWRRFDIHITLSLPGQREREHIISRYLAPYGLPSDALAALAEAMDTASPALMRAFCESLKRQIIVGPKLGSDMRKEAVFERLIETIHPHPDLGKPRLWSLGAKDGAVRSIPWPLPLAAEIPKIVDAIEPRENVVRFQRERA